MSEPTTLPPPTAEAFFVALLSATDTFAGNDFDLLVWHAEQPHPVSPAMIAEAFGFADPGAVNLRYGRLGNRLARLLCGEYTCGRGSRVLIQPAWALCGIGWRLRPYVREAVSMYRVPRVH